MPAMPTTEFYQADRRSQAMPITFGIAMPTAFPSDRR